MMDHNQDDLNQYNRKGLPDLMAAAHRGTSQAYWDAARPTDTDPAVAAGSTAGSAVMPGEAVVMVPRRPA